MLLLNYFKIYLVLSIILYIFAIVGRIIKKYIAFFK
jgi:hypothetical protein